MPNSSNLIFEKISEVFLKNWSDRPPVRAFWHVRIVAIDFKIISQIVKYNTESVVTL